MNTIASVDHLLRSTTDAFHGALHAVLEDDVHRARQVLKDSATRRLLAETAGDAIRTHVLVPAPRLADQLQFVADITQVGRLVDELARQVVEAEDRLALSPTQRLEVAVLLDAGERRLRQLTEGPVGPSMDPAYRGCGSALFEVADHGGRDSSSVVMVCAALAVVLLQASRHATRAA